MTPSDPAAPRRGVSYSDFDICLDLARHTDVSVGEHSFLAVLQLAPTILHLRHCPRQRLQLRGDLTVWLSDEDCSQIANEAGGTLAKQQGLT